MSSLLDPSPQICIVVDEAHTASTLEGSPLSGYQDEVLRGKILRAGFNPECVSVCLLENYSPRVGTKVIVGLGEKTLKAFTGKRGIDKWVLSPLRGPDGEIFIPCYDFGRLQRQYELNLYLDFALKRARSFASVIPPTVPLERFLLNPGLEETYAVLDHIKGQEEIAVDVETGYGQINTVGFAWSESDAIAIGVLPDRCGDSSYFELWTRIRAVLEAPSRKVFQNFIYDVSCFSAYGIDVQGDIFDTMWAMKVLWPELKSNLGNVGRIYTNRPYWKDDGKVTDEEGQKKDWGQVRDWIKHFTYNCRDTTGTLDAKRSQMRDLEARGLDSFYTSSIARLTGPVREMCARGFPLCLNTKEKLRVQTETEIEELTKEFHLATGSEVNPGSSKQVISWLKGIGVTVPKVFDKDKGSSHESVDAKSIKKIRMARPALKGLRELQEIKTLSKALSSYLNFRVRPDGQLSYTLNGCGTETLRFSSKGDPWGCGFGPLTIPREGGAVSVKSMFIAPEGWTFIEADLKAAETWYVAYASVCPKLMEMLHSGEDVHRHVALAILKALGKTSQDYEKKWRDLGKKTGHGSNYMMKERTFVENVFKDMDMVLSVKEGRLMLDSYFQEFPEIRQWHGEIRRELYLKRKLSAPTGWERYFYGRPGDDMLREAVAWAPQHTVPWVINKMMFHLLDERAKGKLQFHLLCQVHDALYLLVPDEWVSRVGQTCLDLKSWHPELDLPGGRLVIPVEVEQAKCLAKKEKFHG